MEKQGTGFLNDTSLSKTPRSPLKTSTVIKPSGTRKQDSLSKRTAVGDMDSLYLMHNDSTKALHEVTNIPNFVPKPKFNFTCESSFNDSSLGILHMDNFSDFTDSSMHAMINTKPLKLKNKSKGSKSFMQEKMAKCIKGNHSLNSTGAGSITDNENYDDSSSSSDIEYDGTNIPELNMDYDALPATHASTLPEVEYAHLENQLPDEISSSSRIDTQQSDSSEKSGSNTNSCVENMPSFAEAAASKTEDSRNPRDSIFETFEPQYDSFLKTLMSNASSSDPKVSKFLEGCKSLDIDASQMESILQNQSLAEQNFLKSLERLNCPQNTVKFCADEISARSSSFRSPSGTPKSSSEDSAASSNETKQTEYSWKHHPSNEGFKDEEVLSGCLYTRTFNEISEHCNTYTKHKDENPAVSDSAKGNKNASTYLLPEQDSNETIDEGFDCDLNYKNTSVFCIDDECEKSQKLQVSDSEFISSEEAVEIFQKDEENLKQERMFEMGNNSKESVISNLSPPAQTDITAPSWFLELDNSCSHHVSKRHISIGTLISARTENLGRLSQDPKRERPFFGTNVTTPRRNETENSSVISESSELSFENTAPGNKESTLKSVLYESLQSNNESEILSGSVLSQILNDTSTSKPLELAFKIFEKCCLQEKTSHKAGNFPDKPEQSSELKHASMENIFAASKTSNNMSSDKTVSRLRRSSSMDSLGRTENGSYVTEQEVSLTNGLSVSNVESNNQKIETNNATASGCSNCCFHHAPQMISRPPSSCASLCNNPMSLQNAFPSQYRCMKHFGSSQDPCNHNAFQPYAVQPPGGYPHGFQYHNPCIQNILSSQVLTHPTPHPFQQAPMTAYSSLQFPVPGSATICPLVQGPAELVFPEKICIGDSQSMNLTVQNLHSGNYFYHISYISALVNGKPVSLEISGLTLPRIVPRNSGTTTDIQVTLSPKYDGKISVTIQVIASFSLVAIAPSSAQSSFLQTEIQYESLRPSISVSYKAKDSLDIGTIIAGSTVMEVVTINNKCDASVPLCISLSSDMKDNCICFGLNQMKRQKSVNCDWKMISPKAMLYRLPPEKNDSVASDLEIPIIFEAGTEGHVNFVLTAAIETSTLRENLALLRITASVGIAKLILTDPIQSTLLLRANSTCKQNLMVKNHAPFKVVYDINIIEDDTHSFSVSPASLELQPMQTAVLTVSFAPSITQVVKGYLQAAAQPHGKVFALTEVIGDASSEQTNPMNSIGRIVPRHLSKVSESKNSNHTIECNKKYLVWAGVDVGNSVIKTFLIRNSSNKSLQTRLFVKEKSKSFKLLDDKDQPTVTLSLVLATKEEKCISVVFSPTRNISASGFLAIKPLENEQKIFSMPLIGYGGSGKLEVKGLSEREGIGHCLDICGEMKSVFNSITVHNAGSRALFVKVITSVGGASEQSKGQVHINATEFVLLENENKVLYISSTISQQFYSFNATDFGAITLLYGDEIMRQQIRRSRKESYRFPQNNFLEDVNFDVHFDGEERVSYDTLFQSTPKFSSLFAASVKKFLIHLNVIETNNNFSQMSFDALSVIDNTYANLTADSTMMSYRRLTTPNYNHSPPVKEFTTTALNRLSMPLENYSDTLSLYIGDEPNENATLNERVAISWTVKPDTLTIDTVNKDNRILLINLSNQDLKFRIECEIHVISVSPVSGIITAKGQIGLRITIIPYSYVKLSEDYQGYIKVICDGVEKSVHVAVLKDKKKSKDASPPNETNLYAERKPKSVMEASSVSKTFINSPPSVIQNIHNFPKEIILDAAAPEKVSETVVTVQNMENCSAHWNIRPISMLFTESMEDSLNCANVLQVSPSSGSLESKETTNIVIKFFPSRIDNYSRFYELSLTLNNGAKQKSNFKIVGKANSWLTESGDLSKSVNVDKSTRKLDLSQKRKSKAGICVENETCEFSATSLGQNNVAYITVKNHSSQDIKINIIKPHPPFFVKYSSLTLRKKTYQKFPITFKPVKPADIYEDILELHSEDGNEFLIKMIGVCNFK